jgi:hypothetical protein
VAGTRAVCFFIFIFVMDDPWLSYELDKEGLAVTLLAEQNEEAAYLRALRGCCTALRSHARQC